MGLFLLVIFVGGSLAFSLRAWASYDERGLETADGHSERSGDEKETPWVVASAIVTFFSAFLSELLRHSYRLSFVLSGAISLVVLFVGEWLAIRFFGQKRAKTRAEQGFPPHTI